MSGTTFPPSANTSIANVIPAYVYEQYADDDNITAFFTGYNQQAQSYLDWFNTIELPVYTSPTIGGALLDWVAQGLYGVTRPTLPSGLAQAYGPFNTMQFNSYVVNYYHVFGASNYNATNDDVFKRILTWIFYKGDGLGFTIPWLKRRILRFLNGVNGTDVDVSNTSSISVTFGVFPQVNINIIEGVRTLKTSVTYNSVQFNTQVYNNITTTFIGSVVFQQASTLQAAINSGALPLPFQYTYVVTVVP